MVGGAWPFFVGGAIRLVDSDNDRGHPTSTGSLAGSCPRPRSPPGTPLGFLCGHEPHACDCGPSCTTIGRCHTTEHPLPPTCMYPAEPRPQLVSLPGCESPWNSPGFYFRLCVCLCVWRRLLSRTAEVFSIIVNLLYICDKLALCPSCCK